MLRDCTRPLFSLLKSAPRLWYSKQIHRVKPIREISQTLSESFRIDLPSSYPIDRSFEKAWKWIKNYFLDNSILLSILYTMIILLHRKRSFDLDLFEICINSYGITHRRDSSKRFALFVTRVSESVRRIWSYSPNTIVLACEFQSIKLKPRLLSRNCIIKRLHQLNNEANYAQFTWMDLPSHYQTFINSVSKFSKGG